MEIWEDVNFWLTDSQSTWPAERYPTSELQHLRDAYRLDYNAIVTEIDTEDIFVKTLSNQQAPSGHHIAKFNLHDPNKRLSFFGFSERKK